MGQAGVLDGRRATTYVGGEKSLQKMFPKAKVQYDQQVVTDGNLITSNGAVISYEASLLLLEKLAGASLAQEVADEIITHACWASVIVMHRGFSQFSN